jgi:hypothetical protein
MPRKRKKKKPAYPPKRRAKEPFVIKGKDLRSGRERFKRELDNGTHEEIIEKSKEEKS